MMTKEEAVKLLKTAPQSNTRMSKVNPGFTELEVVEIVRGGIEDKGSDEKLRSIFEKRVWQVVKNQRRPRY